ncbi:S-layer protein [Candidatus Woesearchaeota archaeon]|nr:S-layer protein [Candidatus Woesearchaeota archaeon]
MKVRKAIQRIVALGTGALMMGATMLGATAAANLNQFPKPMFIGEDGTFNGVVVVGDSAVAEDVIGATNVMAALQSAAVKKELVESASGAVTLGGDSKKISQSTNKLEFQENLRATGITSVTASDLTALKKGSIKNEFGEFVYTQYIELPAKTAVYFTVDPDDGTSAVAPYLKFNQSTNTYTYKISFTPALKSDHATSDSTLEDLENKKLNMFGKEYTITTASHPSKYSIALTLMGGAIETTMDEYTSKTFTIKDKEYKVKVLAIATESSVIKAKFQVNDEVADPLAKGETYALEDGTEIGVRDLLENEGTEEGGADVVTFFLGAQKVLITDTATNVTNAAGTVQVGSNKLDNVYADIVSTSDEGTATNGNDVYVSGIEVGYNASNDLYVPVNGKLSTVADIVEGEEGNIFLNGFDVEFKGIEIGSSEDIKFSPSGNDNYQIDFYTKAGDHINQEVYGYLSSGLYLGKVAGSLVRNLVTSPTTGVDDEDYVLIGDGTSGGYGRILQFKSVQDGDDMYVLSDIGSGEKYYVTYNSVGTGTLVTDGFTTTVRGQADGSTSLNFSTAMNSIFTKYGANISFAVSGTTSQSLDNATTTCVKSEACEDSTTRDTVCWHVYYDSSNSQIQMNSTTAVTGVTLTKVSDDDDKEYEGYSAKYGMKVHFNQPTSGQRDLILTYPDDQATWAVFYTGAQVSEAATAEGTYTEKVVPIPVSASKLASEVADITAQNAIVVGGPCANSASAKLMGNPADCAAGFVEGKAMIKLFENDGNVALLVAGYSALDTRRATTVLANHGDYADSLVGTEVVVSGTTLSDIKVSKPVAEAPVVETPEPEAEPEATE